MARYKLTKQAERDLRGIYEYSYSSFGEERADNYLLGLERVFQMIADNPNIGRSRPDIDRSIHCHEHGKHVVFYDVHEDGVHIVRVLHERMDVKKHL